MEQYTSSSETETEELAARLAHQLRAGDVVALEGGLGAGKTAFVRGLCRGLGIDAEVSSPTFALVHEYRDGDKVLHHFDMYRIQDGDALYDTGFFEYLDGGGILAIEWSERIRQELPPGVITVTLTPTGENSREIRVEGGERL